MNNEITQQQKAVIESFTNEYGYYKRIEIDEYIISFSELAVYVKIAGKKAFLAYLLGENNYGLILTTDGNWIHGASLIIWHKSKEIGVC